MQSNLGLLHSFLKKCRNCKVIFWVLKGNIFEELSKDITQDITHKINVSFMAGMPIKSIQEKLGDS